LPKLWAIKYRVVFYETRCTFNEYESSSIIIIVDLFIAYCKKKKTGAALKIKPKITIKPDV